MEIRRTALVPHSAMDMYRLVLDVAAYPQFLSWCVSSRVLEQTDELQLASLEISIAGLRQAFTTRNRLARPETILLALADGPFRRLSGAWNFQQLGTAGCKVSLELGFEFSGSVLSAAFRRGFAHVADRLVADFSQRASQVYAAPRVEGGAGM